MHVITLTLQYFLSDAILVENLTIEILWIDSDSKCTNIKKFKQ